MRRSGWILPALALVLWTAAVAFPAVALQSTLGATASSDDGVYVSVRAPGVLLLETSAYALVIAAGASLIGWGPGRVLGRALERRSSRGSPGGAFVPLAAMLLVPMCMPAYAVFYTWWQLWPPDSALHAWAVNRDAVPLLRTATLVVGLTCWSWPIVAWCVAGSVAQRPAERDEMLALDGVGPWRRFLDRVRGGGRGLAVGAAIVFLIAFDNTTCFDLAQIFTYGNELRAKDALGAPPGDVLRAAAPAIVLVTLGAAAVWIALTGGSATGRSGPGPRRREIVGTGLLWGLTLLVPLLVLGSRVGIVAQAETFVALYGRDTIASFVRAAAVGAAGAALALGLAVAWLDDRRWVRAAAHVQAIAWLVAAVVPGTIVGIALEAAYNTAPFADLVYRREAILVIGYVARFGFVAALLARWAAAREPAALADLRTSDGAATLRGVLRAVRPRLVAAATASAAIMLVLALGEVAVTARVHPPGSNPLVMTILNDMHYQRPQTVLIAVVLLFLVALCVAGLVAGLWAGAARCAASAVKLGSLVLLATVMTGGGGCGRDPGAVEPIDARLVFGTTGTAPGQLSYPRAMALDGALGCLYVVDKTARVQRFGFDGVLQTYWRMPAKEMGKPTGISVAPDGRVFVADTHYYRIIAYDSEGQELMRFGSYGEEPGQFIYPTCVAFGPQGRLYVAEYGGHDRIQVFEADGTWLFEFGSFGADIDQFDRPQSILFDPGGTELYVADACNHRIVVTDPEGTVLRVFGGEGTEPGRLHYPYGITFLDDGTLLVAEFGNNRIQRFSSSGEPLGLFGRLGAGEGEVRYPWSVEAFDDVVYVLDSGNNRVQVMDAP